jgi:single-stranded DNA-specific DHH superfamily exonuclease
MALTTEEIEEIRAHLQKSESPIYFFDDDPDGLSSFLLFYRANGRGRGIIVKSSPELKEEYAANVNESNADRVFVLDKPLLSPDFVENCGREIVWLDHHAPAGIPGVKYFNPRVHDARDGRPTSFWCYKVIEDDLWIAMVGMIGDWFIDEQMADKFSEQYPELLPKKLSDPAEILFNTKLGELSRIFSFALKGKTSEVMKCIKILTRIQSPYEILNQESPAGKYIYKKYLTVKHEYDSLINDILQKHSDDSIILYTYPGKKTSFTGEISNELLYRFPERINIIGREKNGYVKCSLRSSKGNLPSIVKKCLAGLDGYGGGHENACGLCVKEKEFETFMERFKKEVGAKE